MHVGGRPENFLQIRTWAGDARILYVQMRARDALISAVSNMVNGCAGVGERFCAYKRL